MRSDECTFTNVSLIHLHLASNSHYGGDSNPGNNLHVSGLSAKVTDRDLEEAFGKFGKVRSVPFSKQPQI